MSLSRSFVPAVILPLLIATSALSHETVARARKPVRIPDIPGYITLKCDFHIHTVFSDGHVWPTVRVEEAWREGLDAIAITDHIEYQPHKDDITTNHNRSFEVALPHGKDLDVIVIKGSEITRSMPPGHLNAIFLTDSQALAVKDWRDALSAAHKQEAFIFWNHPGWGAQAPNRKAVWHPEHTELLEKGMLHGIEVVNSDEYYPEAHRWAIEHNLTMLSNTDIHQPIAFEYGHDGDFRPTTLVFARERTAAGIKEALRERRTAVYYRNKLVGTEKYLLPLFERSISVMNPVIQAGDGGRKFIQLRNDTDLDIQLKVAKKPAGLNFPDETIVPAGKIALMIVNGKAEAAGELGVAFKVLNFLQAPDTPLEAVLKFRVE